MRVRFSKPAADDLEEIALYVAKENPAAARKLIARVGEASRMLARFPNAGRKGRVKQTRELILTGLPYIVVYAVAVEEIVIVALFHASRDVARVARSVRARRKAGRK